ncbi:MAG: hypothetical protein K8M05_23660 [Deltaproteobacteria bacterium]|nr:hypothetical protein [Kofleriaceae bacterium]
MASRFRGALADAETRWRWLALALVGCVLVASSVALFVGEDGQGRPVARPYADAPYYYAWAPTLFLDHDVDFTNQYRETKNWYRFGVTPTRKPANVFGAGPGILSAPAFLPAHAAAVVSGEREDGFSRVELVATMWLSVLLSVTALVFPYRIAARRLGARGAGLAAALLVFAAGPVVYYAVRQPGYAHPFATFFAAWFVDAWDASFDRRRTSSTAANAKQRPQVASCGRASTASPNAAPSSIHVRAVRRRSNEASHASTNHAAKKVANGCA